MIFLRSNIKYSLIVLTVFIYFSCKPEQEKNKTAHKYTNDLINETSPYLLQHAHNPVDWKSWNSEAFKKAKEENKLIIISVGYSACHWCHVMEEESFKNDTIAKLMNDNFVSIKIDKEERPDINQIYVNAVELITGSSGWPLNCIALPDGRPVFGGTYFTKEQWQKALIDISNVYNNNPEKVLDYAEKLTTGIRKSELIALNTAETEFTEDVINKKVYAWNKYLDFKDGGQLTETKFPLPNDLRFQLRHSIETNQDSLKDYVKTTLRKMAFGGIFDQIGGGFSRYSVDKRWHIPHFEKMLYDNSQLVSLYSEAYQATKNPLYKTIVEETLEFVKRELTNTEGAFYTSLDADSKLDNELEEGAFYSWTKAELQNLLKEDFNLFSDYYNISDFGKWENNYILIRKLTNTEFIKTHNLKYDDLEKKIKTWKSILFLARKKRNRPRLDDKILTSWNALMAKGYLDAYRVFKNEDYLKIAKRNIEFLLEKQQQSNGSLNHNYKNGKSTINGYLEDYANVIGGLIALYQNTFEKKWLEKAKELTSYTLKHFMDDKTKMFYFTSDEDEDLITRKIDVIDNVTPSSNSLMANNLFQLGHYYENKIYSNQARQMVSNILPEIQDAPSKYSNWLMLMSNYARPYFEVAFAGQDALKKNQEINAHYLPNILVAGSLTESDIPLMKNRLVEGDTYIYVCVNGTCKLPIRDINQALRLIKK